MTRWLREFRLVPVVLIAAGSLFVLKTMGLILDGGYTLGQRLSSRDTLTVTRVPMTPTQELQVKTIPLEIVSQQNQGPKRSWMQEMFNYPGGASDVTGSIHGSKPAEKPAAEKAEAEKPKPKVADPSPAELKAGEGKVVEVEQKQSSSPAERALLERLQARREELDKRARELDLRETMLKAAEKKLEPPAKPKAGQDGKPDEAAEKKDSPEKAQMKSLVTMYETMKPKDAAKIFDRLDPKILIEVASHMKPQAMAAVLAVMSPEAAERLTVELATRSGAEKTNDPLNLPKIEGRP